MNGINLDECEILVQEIEDGIDENGFIEQIMVDCCVTRDDAIGIAKVREIEANAKRFLENQNELALCVRG